MIKRPNRAMGFPEFILWTILGCALPCAFQGLTSSVFAVGQEVTLTDQQFSSDRNFRFFFQADAGVSYPIEVSTDLIHWSRLATFDGTGEMASTLDRDATNFLQRFYHIGIHPTPVTNMVYINPGVFTMGSPLSEVGRGANEGPQMTVTLSRGFWIGKYEVTQLEYIAIVGANASLFENDHRLPVDFVRWIEATNYCYKLTQSETAAGRLPAGYVYRLPTEAEWEYACRADSKTPVGVGAGNSLSSTQANFDGNFPYNGVDNGPYINWTTLGGTYAPNAWGLCDMHGNVWEWCQDIYDTYPGGSVTDPKGPTTGSARVLRGGAFNSVGAGCRSAKRDNRPPTYRNFGQGFRVVLTHDP